MTQLQRMNITAVEPGPQSGFLNRLLEAFPAEAVEGCAHFRVGSWVRSSYPICLVKSLKLYQGLSFVGVVRRLRGCLFCLWRRPFARLPALRAALTAKTQ